MKSYHWRYENTNPEVADVMYCQAICRSGDDINRLKHKTLSNMSDINHIKPSLSANSPGQDSPTRQWNLPCRWRVPDNVPIWVPTGKIQTYLNAYTSAKKLLWKQFDRWPWNTIGHLFYATLTFVHHFVAIGEFKLILTPVTLTFDFWPWPFAWASLLSLVMTPKNTWWYDDRNIVKTLWQTGERADETTDGRAGRRTEVFLELL